MACSRFEYVKVFEQHTKLLPCTWAVIRLDGRNFTSFAKLHKLRKPNDERALHLANAAAKEVLSTFDDHLIFAYGQSDEYSFILKRQSSVFSRRHDKILSTVLSLFTSAYVLNWPRFMQQPLEKAPSFDARIVQYPTTKHLRDYLSWRQADVHVNNLFNTAFWALVGSGKSNQEAELLLKESLAKDKNELLFNQFGINYNDEHPMFRKGSFVMKTITEDEDRMPGKRKRESADMKDEKEEDMFVVLHVDIIGHAFWNEHTHLLGPSDLQPPRIRKG